MAKVKMKVTKRYSDVVTGKIQEVGDILRVDEQRAQHLMQEGVAVMETDPAAGQEAEGEDNLGDQGKENG